MVDCYDGVCSVHREIGPRSKIWSEKEYVDKAAFEFSDVSVTRFCATFNLCGING